jgi:hypothetical protein
VEASYRKNVAGRRQVCKDLAALHMSGQYRNVRDWVEENAAALGRTQEWKNACAFLVEEFDKAESHPDADRIRDWAILQGITYMNMYAQ